MWGASPPQIDIFVQIWLLFFLFLICSCNFDFVFIIFENDLLRALQFDYFLICSLIFLWLFRKPLILEKLSGNGVSTLTLLNFEPEPLIESPTRLNLTLVFAMLVLLRYLFCLELIVLPHVRYGSHIVPLHDGNAYQFLPISHCKFMNI